MTPLLARASAADRQFERMYRRYVSDVYRYSLAVLRNTQDAEDVTQTTFLNAYRAMQRGQRPETPKNWLIAIAHNVCRQRFRQGQRRPQELPLADQGADAADVERDERYTAADLQRALGQLAFNQRAALVMRELEGRSYAEIAGIMGLTVASVETLLFRSRRALREQLEGTLSCAEAEFYCSKQLDGELTKPERAELRAHVRGCTACEQLARKQRATRGSLKALLGGLPVPASLWGGSGMTAGLAVKAATVVAAGAVVGTGGYQAAVRAHVTPFRQKAPVAVAVRTVPGVGGRVARAAASAAVAPVPAAAAAARPRAKLRAKLRAKAAARPVAVASSGGGAGSQVGRIRTSGKRRSSPGAAQRVSEPAPGEPRSNEAPQLRKQAPQLGPKRKQTPKAVQIRKAVQVPKAVQTRKAVRGPKAVQIRKAVRAPKAVRGPMAVRPGSSVRARSGRLDRPQGSGMRLEGPPSRDTGGGGPPGVSRRAGAG